MWPTVVLAALASLAASPGGAVDAPAAKTAAIVSALEGRATRTSGRGPAADVKLYDWLDEDTIVETADGARVVLTLTSGKRYGLGPKTKVTVAASGPRATAGEVRELPPVPSLPRMPAIDREAQAGGRPGAVRVRAAAVRGLYPAEGAATLADAAVLQFEAVAPEMRYRIEIEDEGGRTVLGVDTSSTTVSVPAGVLKPGSRYYWSVRTLPRVGPTIRGEAELLTLDVDTARRLTDLRSELEKSTDAESLGLLAAVDQRLGRKAEARAAMEAACARPDAGPALRALCSTP